MDQTVIESEEQAWEVLRDLVRGAISDDVAAAFELGDWASLSLNIKGRRYQSSVTPRLMQGLLTFHNNLSRTLALTQYGRADGRTLNYDDQERLQLVFEISGGSTGIKAKVSRATRAEITVPPRLSLMMAIIVALAYCSGVAIKSYFDTKQSAHNVEMQRERTEQSRQETERLRLLRDAYEQLRQYQEKPEAIEDMARNSYMSILKSVPDAERVDVGGIRLNREQIERILDVDLTSDNFPRHLRGVFTVRGLRNAEPQKYYLHLERGDARIRASYDPTKIDAATTRRITDALINKSDLKLHVVITGRYRSQLNATVVSFE
jgi:hypothetical protein